MKPRVAKAAKVASTEATPTEVSSLWCVGLPGFGLLFGSSGKPSSS